MLFPVFSQSLQTSCLVLLICYRRCRQLTLVMRLQTKHAPMFQVQLSVAFRKPSALDAPSDEFVFHNDAPLAVETLQVLWVNDNSLSRISNLDYNPTIKSLYAHNNRIGTLKVSFRAVRV